MIANVSGCCLVESEILLGIRNSLEIFGQSEKADQTRWRLPSCEDGVDRSQSNTKYSRNKHRLIRQEPQMDDPINAIGSSCQLSYVISDWSR
ncbi:hypothetical protein M0802_004700 [Mischocyttarus mexicanus]|nr:hypothetical protein M0802_004700 [Mischocyttarus mexicanus]